MQQGGFNSNTYEFDYFSGSQIGVYIGDILVDDVASINFTVTQSKRPIYGYASQYFHTVAAGQVLVEGTFLIPFKESNYLLAVLERFNEKMGPIHDTGIPGGERDIKVLRENVERRIKAQITREKERDRVEHNAGGMTITSTPLNEVSSPYEFSRSLAALSDEDFEDIAETFEDVLWQSENVDNEYLSGNLPAGKKGDHLEKYRRADQYPPFDIWILYGDISNKAANHTIKKLDDVHIVGQGQAIEVGGEPVVEQYRFLAKNLI